jgi:hypothetical protein
VRVGRFHGEQAIAGRQLGASRTDAFLLELLGGQLKVRSTVWKTAIKAAQRAPLGRWVHVAFTHTAEGTTRLYQDGAEVGRQDAVVQDEPWLDTPIVIGADINGPNGTRRESALGGAVDEVAVYDRALSVEESGALARGLRSPAER